MPFFVRHLDDSNHGINNEIMFSRIHGQVALALLGLSLTACKPQVSVIDNVRKQIESGANEVDMRSAASGFPWDGMFVFGPYAPREEICKIVGLSDRQCSKADIDDVDESEFLLLFVDRSAVSRVERVPRTVADFDETPKCSAKLIKRADAVFSVVRNPRVYLMCR